MFHFICCRLVQICKYFLYQNIYTHRKTIGYCIGLWGFAVLLDLPNWLGWGGHTFGLKEMGCTYDRMANHSYTIFLATTAIAIPMVIVLSCYLSIILYVRKCRRDLQKFTEDTNSNSAFLKDDLRKKTTYKKDDLQFALILFISFLAFVICWSPYMTALVFDRHDTWPKEVYVIGTLLGHSNSCLNPIIYAMGYARFRRGYYVFIHKLFCLRITDNAYLKESKTGSLFKRKSTTHYIRGSKISTPILDHSIHNGGELGSTKSDLLTSSSQQLHSTPTTFVK